MLGFKEIHVSKTGPKSEFPSDITTKQEAVKTMTSGAASDDIAESFYNWVTFLSLQCELLE